MDVGTLEQWLWDAACEIRGPLDAPKFKDYILPLVFLKRLSDVFDDEIARLADEFGDEDKARALVEADHSLVRFYIPEEARWSAIATKTTGLGEYLTDAVRAVARENPKLQGVIDVQDFNETAAGQRTVDDARLQRLVQILGKYRLGLDDVEPDLLGRAYEYLLRKFAEGSGSAAGEFYTPREVAILMARILDPQPGMSVYDPCCGSAGLLIKQHLRLLEIHGKEENGRRKLPPQVAPLSTFGQEINPSTYAIARMNAVIHDMEAEIALGDTMRNPRFTDNGKLRRFDLVAANPMWNQDFATSVYENDPYGRFDFGIPPASNADWGWVQHMFASLGPEGRMAVVLDTGAVDRGSGNSGSHRERSIRQRFVELDVIDAVILLPENLFYNTAGPGIILVLRRGRSRKGEVLFVDASAEYLRGGTKNTLGDSNVERITRWYSSWVPERGRSAIVGVDVIASNDFNLSPHRYVEREDTGVVISFAEAVAAVHRSREAEVDVEARLRDLLRGDQVASNGGAEVAVLTLGELEQAGSLELKAGYAQGTHNDQGNGIPHVRPFNITVEGQLDLTKIKWVEPPAEESPYWLRRGDVLFNNTNSEELTGKTAFFDSDLACTFTNHMTRLRVKDPSTVEPEWLAAYLHERWRSGFFRQLLRRYVGQAGVSLTRLRSVEVELPPVSVQRDIAVALRTINEAKLVAQRRADALSDLVGAFRKESMSARPVQEEPELVDPE